MNKFIKQKLIIDGDLRKAILFIAIPLMLSNFFYSAYNFIDTLFVSRIGSDELSTIALISPLFNIFQNIGLGITVSGTALIGREIGAGKDKAADRIISHLFVLSMVTAFVLMATILLYGDSILVMASATKNIIANGSLYFRMLSFSVPVLFFNACYMAIKGGYGFTKDIMKANIISMIVKFVLNYIFIILMGKGIVYMALSSFIGAASILIYGLVDLNKTKIYQFIEIKHFKFDFVLVKNILIVSIPVIVEKSLISFSFIVINSQVLVYGETVLAAYGITNRINSMFFRVLGGLGSGIATIVSQNFGANKYQRIKDTLKFSMVYAVIISSIFAGLIFLTDNMLVGFLAGDDLVLTNHTLNAISTYSISIIPWAIFQVYLGLFMGLGRTKYNLIISLMRLYLFRLPLIVAFTNFTNFGEYSIWIAMLISNILTGLLGYLVYVFTFKKTIIDKISGNTA